MRRFGVAAPGTIKLEEALALRRPD